MKEYVLGFLFLDNGARVLLIRKMRPEHQKGRVNGIGGKVEPGETYSQAMAREFKEEAGVKGLAWEPFAHMTGVEPPSRGGQEWCCMCFRAFAGDILWTSQTDEQVFVSYVKKLPANVMPHLHWLIPMALVVGQDLQPDSVRMWHPFPEPSEVQ